ncbi:uncharacterized protein LOC135341260 [Halichondria panicea]
MCDFAIRLKTLVEARELTGFYCEVKREMDGVSRRCFFTSDSANQKVKFISQLNKSFGSGGGFTCAFSDSELTRFLQFLKREHASDIKISKGTTVIGCQPGSDVWVFGDDIHIKSNGECISATESPYVWSPNCIMAQCDKVSFNELVPKLSIQSSSMEPLKDLLDGLQIATKHNYPRALLVLGGTIMSCHYTHIAAKYGGFPIVLAVGPTETGKSTALKAALSIFGMAKDAFYVEGSNAYFMERSALSCMPYGIDEATAHSKQLDVVKLIVDLHGAAKTANLRRGAFLPLSVPVIATNDKLKDDPRVKSRCVEISFRRPKVGPSTVEERKSRRDLESSIINGTPSGILHWVISLRQDLEKDGEAEVERILQQILQLPQFSEQPRLAQSWALILYFTFKMVRACGKDELENEIMACVTLNSTATEEGTDKTSSLESVVTDTVREVLEYCNGKVIRQVLTFVRTRLMVSNQEVVAIHLSHNGLKFTHSLDEIRNAVDQLEWGKGTDSKDFLNPTKHSGTLINRKTSDRVRAANIFLNKLPKNLHDVLRRVTDPETPLAEVIKCGLEVAEKTPCSEEEENSGPGLTTETEAVDGDKKHATVTTSLTETDGTSTDGSVDDGDKKRATRSSTIVPPFSKRLCKGNNIY